MEEIAAHLAAIRTSLCAIGVGIWVMIIFKTFSHDHSTVLHEIVDQLKQIVFKMK